MKYFTPETSKKLEEMGLKGLVWHNYHDVATDEHLQDVMIFSTLDICELENAKKLWGIKKIMLALVGGGKLPVEYEVKLREYITLSDEERVMYIEDYLSNS